MKILGVLALFLGVTGTISAQNDRISERLIMVFEHELFMTDDLFQNYRSQFDAKINQRFQTESGLIFAQYDILGGELTSASRQELLRRPGVLAVEPDQIGRIDASLAATLADSQWYHNVIRLADAHQITKGSSDIIIALIDTGIDFEHEALSQQIFKNANENQDGRDSDGNGFIDDVYGWNFVQNNSNTQDDHGHGTAMAGIMVGQSHRTPIFGIAPHASVLPLKAFNNEGRGRLYDVIRAVLYAADNGAHIINMSYGFDQESYAERLALQYAREKGLTLITSAGNVGGPNKRFPAAYPEVIAVSWTGKNDRIAPLSSYGPHIAVAAPGTELVTTDLTSPGVDTGFRLVNGSSASSAVVSGIAALVLSQRPDLTHDQIRAVVQLSADDVMNQGWDNFTGAGRVNAEKALLQEHFAKVALDSVILSEHDVAFFGSAYHPSIREKRLKMALGLREPLSFTKMAQGAENKMNELLFRIPRSEFQEAADYQTLAIEAEGMNGEIIAYRKHFLATFSPPELERTITFSGYRRDTPVSALSLTTNYPVDASIRWNSFTGSQSASYLKPASSLIYEIPMAQLANQAAELNVRHPDIKNLKTQETVYLNVTPRAEKWEVLPSKVYELETERTFAFSYPGWEKFDDVIMSLTQNGGTFELSYYHVQENELSNLPSPDIFGVPRAFSDVTGDGKPELLLQFGSSFSVLALDSEDELPLIDITNTAEPADDRGWGITIGDISGNGKAELWAHDRNGVFFYEYKNGAFVRNSVYLPVPGLTTPVGKLADFTQNGRNELLIANDNHFFLVGYEAGTYQILAQTALEFHGLNLGFTIIYHDGQPCIVASSVPESTPDRFGITPAEFQVLYLISIEDLSFEIRDKVYISGAATSQRDMQTRNVNGESWAIYSNRSQLYAFDVWENKLRLRFFTDELQTINTAVLGSGLIGVGAGNGQLRLVGNGTTTEGIYSVKAPFYEDRIAIYAQIRGEADAFRVRGENEELLLEIAQNLSAGQYWKIGSIPVSEQTDAISLSFEMLHDGHLLSQRSQTFERQPEFVISNVSAIKNRLLIEADEPIFPGLSAWTQILDYLPGNVIIQDVQVANPKTIHMLFSENLPEEFQLSFPWIRDPFYAQARNAEEVFHVQTSIPVETGFYITNSQITDLKIVEVSFSKSLDTSLLHEISVAISPRGVIRNIQMRNENTVALTVDETILKGSGVRHVLTFNNVIAADGSFLRSDIGNQIEILDIRSDLSDVRVYPNPWRTSATQQLTFANIPENAKIRIYATDGRFLTELIANEGIGGVSWDGRTERGEYPGSGVYLFQVITDQERSDWKRLVIIR